MSGWWVALVFGTAGWTAAAASPAQQKECRLSETLESVAEVFVPAELSGGPPPGETLLGYEKLIEAVECRAHETGQESLCELLRREPGRSVHSAICATDVYGREFARLAARGAPTEKACRGLLSATFEGMDHKGLDIPSLIPQAGWDRLCPMLSTDFRDRTLAICSQVVYELGEVLKPDVAAHYQMEYIRNVCPPDIGALTQGSSACEVTSNAFDMRQCRTNARVAEALRRKNPGLCAGDELCLAAVTRRKGLCDKRSAEVVSLFCRHSDLMRDHSRRPQSRINDRE